MFVWFEIKATHLSSGELSKMFTNWFAPTLVAIWNVIVFWPVLQNEFVQLDDRRFLVNNPSYRGLGWEQLKWMWTTAADGHYMPLTWMTYGLDYIVWGMNPTGYHLTNLILHVINAILFYFLSECLLTSAMQPTDNNHSSKLSIAAAVSALLFSIHPLRVESVAWATERRDVLSGLFFLLAILVYVKSNLKVGGRVVGSWRSPIAISVLFLMSLLSKVSGAGLPFILVLLDIYPLRRLPLHPGEWFCRERNRLWMEKAPLLILALGFSIVSYHTFGHSRWGGVPLEYLRHGEGECLVSFIHAAGFYVWKTLFPVNLAPQYLIPELLHPLRWPFILSTLFVCVVTLFSWALRNRWPAGLVAWGYYMVALAPLGGLVKLGFQITSDRYSYLPCMAWAVLGGGGMLWWWRVAASQLKTSAFLGGLAVLAVLSFLTRQQVHIWHDSVTLLQRVLTVNPGHPGAHLGLGVALMEQGKLDEAISHYQEALKVSPNYMEAHYNLGLALAGRGRWREAIRHYQEVLRRDSKYVQPRVSLGLALLRLGAYDEAAHHYRKVLELEPDNVKVHNHLGVALMEQGRPREGTEHFQEALRINPGYVQALNNLGLALARQGDLDRAIQYYREALRIDPNYQGALYNLHLALKLKAKNQRR